MPRVVWKGAIVFGLVHIPVNLYPGARAQTLDLDLIDKRDFSPVGYQRINKVTGEEVSQEDIVKGYQYEKGEYVVVTEEDMRQANVAATQTVDIHGFVALDEIQPWFFDTPYYLEPDKRGEKGYALLREVLRKAGRVGIASVVIRSRQHLAAVMPVEDGLVLDLLRYADEIRPLAELALPPRDLKRAGVSAKELDMAERLVADMTEPWQPTRYRDKYRDDLMAMIERKVKSGQTHALTAPSEEAVAEGGAEVIDLMAMLRKSLDRPRREAQKSAARETPREERTAPGADAEGGSGGERQGRAKPASTRPKARAPRPRSTKAKRATTGAESPSSSETPRRRRA
jgi:DNA end-binding protein Ku